MNIQTQRAFAPQLRNLPTAPTPVSMQEAPKDFVSIQSDQGGNGGGHFSGGNVVFRMAGGAINGLLCNYLSGGSVGRAALIGGGTGAVLGGAAGAITGGLLGAAGGAAGEGALLLGGTGAIVGGVAGAAKGAATIALANAFGGGPLAAAGVGAALSLFI